MSKTDNILEKLKAAQQPVIDNPDELTDLIMSNLPEQDNAQFTMHNAPLGRRTLATSGTQKFTMLRTLRIISSMAAVYLVGLFFYLQAEPSNKAETAYNNKVELQQPSSQPYCTEGTPREILMCYLERKKEQPSTYSLIKQRIQHSQMNDNHELNKLH